MASNKKNNKPKQPRLSFRKLKSMDRHDIVGLLPDSGIDNGGHETPLSEENEDGRVCLMEAVAYITGEPHSDHPRCACPALTEIGINFNDSHFDDHERNKLIGAIPALVGSRTGSARVRFKRAKAAAKRFLQKACESLEDQYSEGPTLELVARLDANQLKTHEDVKSAVSTLEIFMEDSPGDPVQVAYDSLEQLSLVWDPSNGISEKELLRVFDTSTEISQIFDDAEEQAEFLRSIGLIRS